MKSKLFTLLVSAMCVFAACEDNIDYDYTRPVNPNLGQNVGSDYYPYDRVINAPLDNYLDKVCTVGTESLKYRALYPADYKKGTKYPLIVVLHGSGERGDDNHAQLSYGASFFLKEEVRSEYPAIVLFPQCPKEVRWDSKNEDADKTAWTWKYTTEKGTAPMEMIKFLVEDMVEKGIVDENSLYVGGISMGAMGAYELAYRLPIFKSGFFMSGGGNPAEIAEKLPNMSFRIMHGDADGVVLPMYATEMEEALTTAGIKNKLDMYEDVGHSNWNSMFEEEDFMSWMW